MMTLLLLILVGGAVVVWLQMREKITLLGQRVAMLEDVVRAMRYAAEVAPVEVPREQPLAVAPEPEPLIVPAAELPTIEPEPEPEPEEPVVFARRGPGFEDIFGRYLPIWAGGVTLIVAGVLIVKYSIDAGLLSPLVRVIAGLVFGTALIGGAEAALRNDRLVGDRRIRQSLAGAGLATLYASILVAANLYHLVDPMTAFVGLALVTALAAVLSLRFGAPSAVLGLVGGLAAPALVGAQSPNIPLLATYLALTVGGLSVLGRSQRWWWLGALAILGGFGWGMLLILGGLESLATIFSLGTLTLLLAIGFPLLLAGAHGRKLRLAAALAGCAQMAALVATGGFAGLTWAFFGLIAAATIWLGRREPTLAEAPLAGLVIGLLLAVAWPAPSATMLTLVLAGGALIHGIPALWRLWREDGRLGDAAQLAAIAGGIALVPLYHFQGRADGLAFSGLALIGAAVAGGAAAFGWRSAGRAEDARFALLALPGIALALLAAGLAFQPWVLAPATAVAAAVALLLARRARDRRIEQGALAFAFACLVFLETVTGIDELWRALGYLVPGDPLQSFARWIVPALAAMAFYRWSSIGLVRHAGGATAVALAYVALAQFVPPAYLALIPALMLAGLALPGQPREARAAPLAMAALLAFAWAALPLLRWVDAAAWAAVGVPMLVTALPAVSDTAIRIAALVLALVLLLGRKALPPRAEKPVAIGTAVLATIVIHIFWKQVFAISDPGSFLLHGMTERTLWEGLFLVAALGAWRLDRRWTAAGFGVAGLLHFTWFTLLLHNPLWAAQSVGPWLIPAYGVAWTLVGLSSRVASQPVAARLRDAARMVLILVFAASALRQLFHGSILVLGATTPAEDILRSLLAILLAIGFLWWGIARANRDWRIASLVLMLGAVAKVFLLDAAGLDGLLRIGSFVALGFSLIGVGWLYSRYLPDARLTGRQHSPDTDASEAQG